MKMQNTLQQKLEAALAPSRLEIENESHKHSSGLGAESHFKVLVVSQVFEGMSRVQRQRHIYDLLVLEMKSIHALSLRLLTAEESAHAEGFATPNCNSKKQ
ncbi:MAG: BolA family transcriptional regulator [Bdellovibrionaceae bacterium]|nr:BolA family transcriptional regulator [Pseudobdellovibrionaceae bacterium]